MNLTSTPVTRTDSTLDARPIALGFALLATLMLTIGPGVGRAQERAGNFEESLHLASALPAGVDVEISAANVALTRLQLDDGSFEANSRINSSDGHYVQLFGLGATTSTRTLTEIEVCLKRRNNSDPARGDFELIAYENSGGMPGGRLMTPIDRSVMNLTTTCSCSAFPVDVDLGTTQRIHVGLRWDTGPSPFALCADRSNRTSQQTMHLKNDRTGSSPWVLSTGFDPSRAFGIRATVDDGMGGAPTNDPEQVPPRACNDGANTICLQGGRFEVEITYEETNGTTGTARAEPFTPDTGYFWIFDPANIESVVKVLDACAINQNFWVFAGGLTDLGFDITVTDTVAGLRRTYSNPVGTKFQTVTDTSAFASCN